MGLTFKSMGFGKEIALPDVSGPHPNSQGLHEEKWTEVPGRQNSGSRWPSTSDCSIGSPLVCRPPTILLPGKFWYSIDVCHANEYIPRNTEGVVGIANSSNKCLSRAHHVWRAEVCRCKDKHFAGAQEGKSVGARGALAQSGETKSPAEPPQEGQTMLWAKRVW